MSVSGGFPGVVDEYHCKVGEEMMGDVEKGKRKVVGLSVDATESGGGG